jgi:predicted metal-dependent hydrolase
MRTFESNEIAIKFSKRKSIGVYVSPKGVEVRAPIGTSNRYINDFIASKRPWIQKQLDVVIRRTQETYQLTDGTRLPILGQEKVLRILANGKNQVIETETDLFVHVSRFDQSRIDKVFSQYLISKARQIIPPIANEIAKELSLDHKLKDIAFRRTKTKWGHCTHDGRLQFNWLIMMAPMKVIRSLVAHEVCHLEHLNHSPEFWALVQSVDPDYLISKHWLNTYGHRLSLFER